MEEIGKEKEGEERAQGAGVGGDREGEGGRRGGVGKKEK